MMTPRRRHAVGAVLLAVIGIAVMLTGMALHFWKPDLYQLEWSVQLIGAAIAFAGFYAMDPKGAKDGGGFLVDAGTRILSVVREGRRATDPIVVKEVPVDPSQQPSPVPSPVPAVDAASDIPPAGGFPPKEGA